MPTYTVLLAHDVSYYGNVSVEADTWSEAVASLTAADWGDNCINSGDASQERVVHVEAEDGYIEAEDIIYNCEMVHCQSVIQRLWEILYTCDLSDGAAAALVAYIDELRTVDQDPIFKKESN